MTPDRCRADRRGRQYPNLYQAAHLRKEITAVPGRRTIATTTDTNAVFNTFRRVPTQTAAHHGVNPSQGTDSGGNASAVVDGLTADDVEIGIGMPGFLSDLQAQLKSGSLRPLAVRKRRIPTPGGSGKVRRIPHTMSSVENFVWHRVMR